MNRMHHTLSLLALLLLTACTISYRFNGASIDYELTKTIQIDNFPIRSTYVWAPMQGIFQNRLTDVFASQTKLRQVKKNGDMQLAGEITGFDQYNKGISSDGYSSQVQLKMTVNVRFVNNKKRRRLRAAVLCHSRLRRIAAAHGRTGRARHADGQGHHRPDIQRYGSQLVRQPSTHHHAPTRRPCNDTS